VGEGKFTMSYKRLKDAEARMKSARKLVRLLVEADDLYPPQRREVIGLALWWVTEAESGKYNTRYRSRASLEPGADLRHNHVYERAKMTDQLLAHPDQIDSLLDRAVGCVVTKAEHDKLTAVSRAQPQLEGWDRYRAAGIEVIDMLADAE
jgi:hypothetical protein